MATHLTYEPLDVAALAAQTETPESGALVTFAGTVRRHNDGKEVAAISYSAYEPLAEKTLADIERQALEKFDIEQCLIRHRLGDMAIGDASVVVIVRAVHRGEAFEAARYGIDTVKHEVPIWKLETYTDGSQIYVRGCPLHHEAAREAATA